MREGWKEENNGEWQREYAPGIIGVVRIRTASDRSGQFWDWSVYVTATSDPDAMLYGLINPCGGRRYLSKLTDALDACDEVMRELQQKLGPRTLVIKNASDQTVFVDPFAKIPVHRSDP